MSKVTQVDKANLHKLKLQDAQRRLDEIVVDQTGTKSSSKILEGIRVNPTSIST